MGGSGTGTPIIPSTAVGLMKNLLTAIFTHFTEEPGGGALHNDFYDDIGGRMYLDRAPERCEYPYCVLSIVSSNPDYVFRGSLENTYIQFSLFSASSSAVEITTICANLYSLFDDCALTVTSSVLVWFARQNLVTMIEDITVGDGTQQIRHWAVDYSIMTQAT